MISAADELEGYLCLVQRTFLPRMLWGVSYRANPIHLEVFAESGPLEEPILYSAIDLKEIHGPESLERAKKHLNNWAMSITAEAKEIIPIEVSTTISGHKTNEHTAMTSMTGEFGWEGS